MKTKDCERLTGEYSHSCDDVQIGIDETDHIVFICKKCKKPLEVIEVKSKNVAISINKKDYCTWIWLVCHNCKTLGKRKFYWVEEDGKYCFNRTEYGGSP